MRLNAEQEQRRQQQEQEAREQRRQQLADAQQLLAWWSGLATTKAREDHLAADPCLGLALEDASNLIMRAHGLG